MRIIPYIIVAFTLIATEVSAETVVPDSIAVDSLPAQQLQELVVEGRTQRVVDHGVEYIPDKRTKKQAIDATNLLQLMSIPQLIVSPNSTNVKTVAGKDVAMFIDYRAATQEDLKGLRTEDVLRVEVLQYPDDPRFESKPYVVNYVMRQYEWGGYTKLFLQGQELNVDYLGGSIYSKFVYKKWTFDANVWGNISYNDRKYSGVTSETFRDFNYYGQYIKELKRTTTSGLDSRRQSNSQWYSLRATYNSENAFVRHTVSFNRNALPSDWSRSRVEFSDNLLSSSEATQSEDYQYFYPCVNGNYFFILPKGNSLSVNWTFGYGYNKRVSTYSLEGFPTILNGNREKVYNPNVTISYSKKFARNNTFRTALMTFNTWYDTEYYGSYDGRQKLLSSENMLFLEYMQNWKWGLSLYSRAGVSYVVGRMNGTDILRQWNPRLGLQLNYNINEQHSASFEGWWGNSHPHPSTANSAIVQSDEMLWLQGNPDLKNTIFSEVTGQYTYIPTNTFSMTVGLKYEGNPDKQAWQFYTLPGYNGLVRRTINSGTAYIYSAWISGNLKLFSKSLSLYAYLKAERAVLTGVDAQSDNMLYASVGATYFLRNFCFNVYYESPQRNLDAWTLGVRSHYKSQYGCSVQYALTDLKVALTFSNWFNSNKYYQDYDSAHYSMHSCQPEVDFSQTLVLRVSYTLPYGKKVQRGGELQNSGSAGSAILK